jgi:RNA polymerase sigma-70 factor (ECF subfamily)
MAPTDEQLMDAYRGGDAGAFDRLYDRYRGPVYRYLLRQCRDETLCEELFQDVWLKLIRGAHQWRSGEPLRPWLFRIAHNRLVDHWRQRREPEEAFDDNVVPMDGPLPDALAHVRDCIERLKALLGHLAAPQRDAFLLKEEGGLTLEQIAEVTGAGRETVKSRLRYAIRRLRNGLEGCDDTA